MRYIISLILAVLGFSIMTLAPVSVGASVVSGEIQIGAKSKVEKANAIKKRTLMKEMASVQKQITETSTSIAYLEKKLTDTRKTSPTKTSLIAVMEKKLSTIKIEKKTLISKLKSLEKRLAEMK